MTKKLFLAVLSVVAVFAALGTTTFAWFTLTSTATIDQINANVEAGEGLLISVDGESFKNRITNTDLSAYISNKVLTAVTPTTLVDADGEKEGLDATEKAEFKKVDTTGALANAVATDYIEFPLWFRVRGTTEEAGKAIGVNWVAPMSEDETPVKLSALGSAGNIIWLADQTVYNAKPTVEGTDPDFTYTGTQVKAGQYYKVSAADAARVSIGNIVHERPATTLAANGGVDAASAVAYGNNVLGDGANLGSGEGNAPFWGAQEYFNNRITGLGALVTNAVSQLGAIAGTSSVNIKTVLGTPGAPDDASKVIVATPTEEVGSDWKEQKVIVRIWLEGWDPECYDMIYKDILTVNLRFEYAVYTI